MIDHVRISTLFDRMNKKMFGKRGPKKHKLFKGLTYNEAIEIAAIFERSFYFCADERYLKNKKWGVIVRRAPRG